MRGPLRGAATAAVVAGVLLLAGCGDDPEPAASPSGSASASASPSASASASPSASGAPAAYNPCDGLRPRPVARALGTPLRLDAGTPDAPRCALLPEVEGKPAMNVNYTWFPGGLDAAWATMGIEGDHVTSPQVAGADAARVVVNTTADAYLVSAFVQSGDLIQSINVVALAPYDAAAVDRAVRVVLAQLAAHAPTA